MKNWQRIAAGVFRIAGLVQWAFAVRVGVVQLMAYVSSPLVFY